MIAMAARAKVISYGADMVWGGKYRRAHRDVEHQHVVKGEVGGETGGDDDLGQLEPWYSKLGKAEEKGKVDEDPLEKEPPRRVTVFDDLEPVVELPCPEQSVEAKGVEPLLRSIEKSEGDDGLAGDGAAGSVFRSLGQYRRRLGPGGGGGDRAGAAGRLLGRLASRGGRRG